MMEGNSKGSGLGGLFGVGGGVGGPGYSHADLAGVPLTGMSPLSPYLNVDPRYLIQKGLSVPSMKKAFKRDSDVLRENNFHCSTGRALLLLSLVSALQCRAKYFQSVMR
uniref:Uncharacterized protein n=1 Tax=Sphaerodactylus townsendi TaxID=933632 RepID=A0ACB8F7T1_9SAUR